MLKKLFIYSSLLFVSIDTLSAPANGFIPVSFENKKYNTQGEFLYCDSPSINGSCNDVIFNGGGNIKSEFRPGKWRNADDYVKYKIGSSAKYADMEIDNGTIFLLYTLQAD